MRAPILTIYVGGNHEAVNYQNELHYGGWVAPNIYFMGSSNVIRYKGLTIGGLSGIYKEMDFDRGYTERVPFDRSRMDSGYVTSFHYRRLEIFKLLSYPSKVDVMVTHDWPSRIYQYGDTAQLLRRKPHFQSFSCVHLTSRDEVNDMCLGSSPLMSVLDELKVSFSLPHDKQPAYWFSAHLHVKFAAIYPHFHSKSPAPPRRIQKMKQHTRMATLLLRPMEPRVFWLWTSVFAVAIICKSCRWKWILRVWRITRWACWGSFM